MLGPDLLQPCRSRAAAFIITSQRELEESEDRRNKFVERCQRLRNENRYLFVIYLRNEAIGISDPAHGVNRDEAAAAAAASSHADPIMESLKSSSNPVHALPPILTCSSMDTAILTINSVCTVLRQPVPHMTDLTGDKDSRSEMKEAKHVEQVRVKKEGGMEL